MPLVCNTIASLSRAIPGALQNVASLCVVWAGDPA